MRSLSFAFDRTCATNQSFLGCIGRDRYEFRFRRATKSGLRSIRSSQFVHATGLFFARIIPDEDGRVVITGILNNMLIAGDPDKRRKAVEIGVELNKKLHTLDKSPALP